MKCFLFWKKTYLENDANLLDVSSNLKRKWKTDLLLRNLSIFSLERKMLPLWHQKNVFSGNANFRTTFILKSKITLLCKNFHTLPMWDEPITDRHKVAHIPVFFFHWALKVAVTKLIFQTCVCAHWIAATCA